MKKMKQAVCGLFALCLLSLPVLAAQDDRQVTPFGVEGTVTERSDDQLQLELPEGKGPYQTMVLNVSEQTVVVDAGTGEIKTLADIGAQDKIFAFVGPMMTRSLPPQTPAVAIYSDLPADFAAPEWAEAQPFLLEAVLQSALGPWEGQQLMHMTGTADEFRDGSLALMRSDTKDLVVLNLSEEKTLILNAATGKAVKPDEIRKGESLSVWTEPVMTMSLPPQTMPRIIVCGMTADAAAPSYTEIHAVKQQADGSVLALTDGDVVLEITGDTALTAYPDGEKSTLEQLRPGTRAMIWQDGKHPQTPEQVMLLPYEYEGVLSLPALHQVAVKGEVLTTPALMHNGKLMMPLRAVVEALGDYEVSWDASAPGEAVVSREGQRRYVLQLGTNRLTVGDEAQTLMTPSMVVDGTTYLDGNDLLRLHTLKLEGVWPGK